MKDEITKSILIYMTPILDDKQLDALKEAIRLELCRYDIKKKETSLMRTDNNSLNYLCAYLENMRNSGKSEGTIEQYQFNLSRMLSYIGKNVGDIKDDDLIDYMHKYKQLRRVGNRYLNNVRLSFNTFFRWLQKKRVISHNPADGLEPIKYRKNKRKPFSATELEKLRCACTCERDIAIIEFLYSSAIRISELVALNRDDIHWDTDDAIVLGKGNKERWVYLNAKSHYHLQKYLERRTDNNPALFVSLRKPHARLKDCGIRDCLKKIGIRAEVGNVIPHRFRHTSISTLLRMGMPIEQAQEIAGHESISTTRIYCDVQQEQVRASHRKYMSI